MKWIDSKKRLPRHNEEVIIRVAEYYDLARFDEVNRGFRPRSGNLISPDRVNLHWMRMKV
jgi:hypothetical protein